MRVLALSTDHGEWHHDAYCQGQLSGGCRWVPDQPEDVPAGSARSHCGARPGPAPFQALLSKLPDSVKPIMSVCVFTPMDEGQALDHQETNVIVYIAGYIIRKLKPKMCDGCKEKLTCPLDPSNPSHEFLAKKNYEGARTGLVAPSDCMVEVLADIEQLYREVSEVCLPKTGVMETLVEAVHKDVSLTSITCTQCHVQKYVVCLMLTIRVHHTLRENNRLFRHTKRLNSITLKFRHV